MHCSGGQKAPAAEPSQSSPGSITSLPQLFRVVDDDDVVVVGVLVLDVVGCSSVVDVVVGHWQFTHSCGVQNAPTAEPSHCSPGSTMLLPQLFRLVEEDDDVDVLVVDDVIGNVVFGTVEELDVVGGWTVVVVVVGHWQLTHSCGVQNEPAAEPSHCSPGSRNAFPQLPPVVEVVDVVVGVTVVDDVVVGAAHTWRSRKARSVFTSRA
jgi:hypothetical protein